MTAIALEQAYQCVDTITDGFTAIPIPSIADKKVSAKEVIVILNLATDATSVTKSKQLIEKLSDIQNALPVEEVDLVKAEQHLDFATSHLREISKLLDFIKFLCDNSNKVEIVDDNMYAFLANMETAKQILEYICDYLSLVLKIQKENGEVYNDFTVEELIEYIGANN